MLIAPAQRVTGHSTTSPPEEHLRKAPGPANATDGNRLVEYPAVYCRPLERACCCTIRPRRTLQQAWTELSTLEL